MTTDSWSSLSRELGFPDLPDYLDTVWPHFQDNRHSLMQGPLVAAADLAQYGAWFGFEPDLIDALKAASAAVEADPKLKLAAHFLHWAMFDSAPFYKVPGMAAPEPRVMGEDRGLFAILLLTRQVPQTLKEMARRGMAPEGVTGNFKSLKGFSDGYRKRTGRYGMDLYFWNALCVTPYLNTAHYLRFNPVTFSWPYTMYRHQTTGEVLCLVTGEKDCRADGLTPEQAGSCAFTASCRQEGSLMTAHRISPCGFVEDRPITVDLAGYERLLGQGDVLLSFHIPTGEGYTVDNCRQSFDAALTFFDRYFPEVQPRGFYCDSWLFSPQLPLMFAPEDSRMVRVQRECFMIPIYADKESFATFVFGTGKMPEDPADLPVKSRLHAALKSHLQAGNYLTVGGMVLPLDELHRFGSQPYFKKEDLHTFAQFYQTGGNKDV